MFSKASKTLKALPSVRGTATACLLVGLAFCLLGCAQVIRRPDIVIGTTGPADADYPLGASICRLFNLDTQHHGLRCAEDPFPEAITNIEALDNGRIDIGIVPSDLLADAVAGTGTFSAWGPAADLRALFAGHADVLTLVAHQSSGIHSVTDLRGKRISIGLPGSRESRSMLRIVAALDLTRSDFAQLKELSPAEQNRAFCANEFDAIVYSVGHPNGLIRDATLTCNGVLVDVSGPAIDRMLEEYGEYERAVIPGGTYMVNPAGVHTVGVRAVVVATTRMPDAQAYEVTRAVFDNFDDFRALHPAFQGLNAAEMVRRTGSAPVHPGAAAYYRERGWLR